MSSVLTDDEDLIMEAYDAATERLSRALEMNPGKLHTANCFSDQ